MGKSWKEVGKTPVIDLADFREQLGLETNSTVATPTILVNDNFEDKDIMDFIIAKEVYVVVYEDETVMLYGPF